MTAKRRINILILGFVILCSLSFYKILGLGPLEKGSELMGIAIIGLLIIFHLVYSSQKSVRMHFSVGITLILLAGMTSMIAAYVTRDQRIIQTLFAQRALYYYFLYFLLHQMKFDVKDMEKLVFFFALLYVVLHFVQTAMYPRVLFNATVYAARGTIRIYLPGAHYIAIAFYWSLQKFFRSNKMKNLLVMFLILIVYVMRGGRFPLAILVLIVVLFLLFDRKVKSRFFIMLLGLLGAFAIFMIFQNIFLELANTSERNASIGNDYIRIKATRYFLTDFFESPLAYITGNGMYHLHSAYGKQIIYYQMVYNYNLGDIGIMGNYAIYGLFFVLGVLIICIKAMVIKIESDYIFIKYYFIAVIIGLVLSGGFSNSDFICMIVCMLYLMDISNDSFYKNKDIEDGVVSNVKVKNVL